jgi:hypothetical protein
MTIQSTGKTQIQAITNRNKKACPQGKPSQHQQIFADLCGKIDPNRPQTACLSKTAQPSRI